MRASGSNYKYALDKLDNVSAKVAQGIYSNPATSIKLMNRAKSMVYATGKVATIETSLKFYAGAKMSQYGTIGFGMLFK